MMQAARTNALRASLLGFAFALAYGGEYLEHIRGRFPLELSDIVADLAGIVVSAACLVHYQRYRAQEVAL